MRFYYLPPEKIQVIYPAISPRFRSREASTKEVSEVLQRYEIRSPYILSVGGMAVHKNVYTALCAFYSLLDQGYLTDYMFVIVGGLFHTHNDQRLFDLADQHNNQQIRFTGAVDDEDLPYIFAGASLFVYPSLYEGFGIAPLEAMACGVPVLAARSGSVPEVVGDAGWLLDDPLDVKGFAAAIVTLVADRDMLAEMSARGLERSRIFTWEQTAERTLALYREVANEQA
jgi:alpha-1,3-rhamnosyl/mannosyltransferase